MDRKTLSIRSKWDSTPSHRGRRPGKSHWAKPTSSNLGGVWTPAKDVEGQEKLLGTTDFLKITKVGTEYVIHYFILRTSLENCILYLAMAPFKIRGTVAMSDEVKVGSSTCLETRCRCEDEAQSTGWWCPETGMAWALERSVRTENTMGKIWRFNRQWKISKKFCA